MSGRLTQSTGEVFALRGTGLGRTPLTLRLRSASSLTFLLTVNCLCFDPEQVDMESETCFCWSALVGTGLSILEVEGRLQASAVG